RNRERSMGSGIDMSSPAADTSEEEILMPMAQTLMDELMSTDEFPGRSQAFSDGPVVAHERLQTRVYPVGDLVIPITGGMGVNDGWSYDFGRRGPSLLDKLDDELSEESSVRGGQAGHWEADRIRRRISRGDYQRNGYQPPQFNGNWWVFYDLLRYAPGLNTNRADLQALIEAEAQPDPRSSPGRIDRRAAELIRKARRGGWQEATIHGEDGKVVMTVEFDGTGRYRYERTTGYGLHERVFCDGTHLWHLYDELGLGAERIVSRFHRREFSQLIPWLLPPADDLACGADLISVDENTVAVVPRGADEAKDKDGKPVKYRRWHLVFNKEGMPAERRLVEMPSGKTVLRQTFLPDGTVKLFRGDAEEIAKWKIDLKPCGAPALDPDKKRLVVLPMPIRERNWLNRQDNLDQKSAYKDWRDEEAMAVLAAGVSSNQSEVRRIIADRFFARGDRRLGFYALLIAGGNTWNEQEKQQPGSVKLQMDPLKNHPGEPLAEYIATYLQLKRSAMSPDDLKPADGPRNGFVRQLAEFRDIWIRYNSGRGDDADRRRERERALRFVKECTSPEFGWAILSLIRNYGGDREFYRAAGEAARAFEKVPSLSYTARYEHARGTHQAGDSKQAQKLFTELWKDTLEKGFLPRFDGDMRNAFHTGDDGSQKWQKLIRQTASKLIDDGARTALIHLAWQVHQVGDQPLAEEIVGAAVSTVPKKQRLKTTLAAVEYFWHTGQHPRAHTMLMPLLHDEKYAQWPSLWRLAGQIAEARGMTARGINYVERAMQLEHENLPQVVNLQTVRQDYSRLLDGYQRLASAIATMETQPPQAFLARVIRAADRWRAIDPDPTAACQTAARIFGDLGEAELAWDYLTTPLAARPNEAAPWVNMAKMLRRQGHLELADRAYASAFEAEPTNAQVLWDRAQVLLEAGRSEDAKKLLRQVADGKWTPQFDWIQTRARQYVENR
ncbi:MAG: hypothetical protein ABIK89_09805, partial [Planctomycetota bacterium]